jgi:hypothetical protein
MTSVIDSMPAEGDWTQRTPGAAAKAPVRPRHHENRARPRPRGCRSSSPPPRRQPRPPRQQRGQELARTSPEAEAHRDTTELCQRDGQLISDHGLQSAISRRPAAAASHRTGIEATPGPSGRSPLEMMVSPRAAGSRRPTPMSFTSTRWTKADTSPPGRSPNCSRRRSVQHSGRSRGPPPRRVPPTLWRTQQTIERHASPRC